MGQLRSGTIVTIIGASFTNNTGGTINSLTIGYTGEQWRFGGVHSTVADKMDFQISFNATGIADNAATWVDIDALDFLAKVTTGTAGALDGNLAANRTALSTIISNLGIANNATFWIRWNDVDATGSDDGLAIDDFSISSTSGPPGTLSIADATQAEGNANNSFTFTVTRSGGSTGAVSASWTLNHGTTNAADFTGPTSGTVNFADGATTAQITVTVAGDLVYEPNETFTITLSAPTGGATITTATGTGTITNDDAPVPPSVDLDGGQPGNNYTGGFFEQGSLTAIGSSITVTQGSLPITSATITITDPLAGDGIQVSFTLPAGIAYAGGDATSFQLVGTGDAATWAAALACVTYYSSSDNPDNYGTDTARTISVTLSDGVTTSTAAIATINIVADNDAPVVGNLGGDSVAYTEGDAYVLLDLGSNATVSDADSLNFASGSLVFGMLGFDKPGDSIFVATVGNVTVDGIDVKVSGVTIGSIDGAGAGEMLHISLNSNATPARVQELLRAIAYTSSSDDPTNGGRTAATIAYVLNDGDGDASGASVTVNITAVDDYAAVTVPASAVTFTEGDSALTLDASLTVIDPDSPTMLNGATVTIGTGYAGSQDVLGWNVGFANFLGIIGNYSNGVLTFTGDGTDADYQAVLRTVTYTNTNNAVPSTADRVITFAVSAASGTAPAATDASVTVHVVGVPDLPTIDLDANDNNAPGTGYAFTYNEGAFGYQIVDNDVHITSVEEPIQTVTIALSDHRTGDQLFVNSTPSNDNITFSAYDSNTGVMTVFANGASASEIEEALRGIYFRNTTNNPGFAGTDLSRSINFIVHSANYDSNTATTTVTITEVNNAAVIGGDDTGAVTEDFNTSDSGTLTVSDVDGSATFQIADLVGTYGGFELQSNGDWTYTLNNAAPIVQHLHTGDTVSDTFTIHSADGTAHDVTIQVAGRDDFAQGTSNTVTVNEDTAYIFAYADFGYSDGDGDAMAGVYIHAASLTGGTLYDNGVAITTNSYFISTADIIAGHLTYQGAPNANGAGLSSFGFQVVDTTGNVRGLDQTIRTMTIDVSAVPDDPTVDLDSGTGGINYTGSYTENDPGVAIGSGITLTSDSGMLQSAVINLTNGSNGDVINLAGTWAGFSIGQTDSQIIITGAGTLAQYQAMLAAIRYFNSTDDPAETDRTITVQVTDDHANSAVATATIHVDEVNDTAVLGGTLTGSATENNPTNATGTVTCMDADDNESRVQAQSGVTGMYGSFQIAENGQWSYAPNDNNFLRGGELVTDTFTVHSYDDSAQIDVVITITGVNDLPMTFVLDPLTASMTEDGGSYGASGQISISDPDHGESGFQNNTFLMTYGSITITNSANLDAPGVSDWSYTLNNAGAAVQGLRAGQMVTDSFNMTTIDGTVFHTIQITIFGVNDAATIGGTITGDVTEDLDLTATGQLTITDPDSGENEVVPISGVTGANGHGTFDVLADGSWTYTLNNADTDLDNLDTGETLTDFIVVTSEDGTDTETITITIHGRDEGANTAPDAQDDNVSVAEDSGPNDLTAQLLANDTDPDNDTRTIVSATQGAHGSVSVVSGVLTYTPNGNYNGSDTFTYTIDDGNGHQDTATVNVTVTAVNDPVGTVAPGAISLSEDAVNYAVTGLSITDADAALAPAGVYEVSLTATHGTLNLSTLTGLTFTDGDGSADTTMTFHGTLADINAALATATYTPDANYNGFDSQGIILTATDSFGGIVATGTGSATQDANFINVTVTAVNDAPVITAPASASTDEDTALVFTGISVADPDIGGGDYLVTLSVSHGTLVLTNFGNFSLGSGGTVAIAASNIANVLNGIRYTPDANYNGPDALTITIDDQGATGSGGALHDTEVIDITVNAVNDAPVNSVPGATQNLLEDGSLTFSAGNGNPISVSDVDAGTDDVTVTLTVLHGTLEVGGNAGLTDLTGDGTATVSFTGSLAEVNNALNGLVYRPAANYNGPDTLQIVTSDNGSSGAGGTLTDTDTVSINVISVNDAPVNTVGGAVAANEDIPVALTGISIFDAEAGPGETYTVMLSVQHGTLVILTNVPGGIGAANIIGGGNGTNGLTISGTLAQINTTLAAMNGLTYQGDPNFNGSDSLRVSTWEGVPADAATFGAPLISSALTNPTSLVTGDVNGDGKLDLVYIGDVAQTVGVRLGNGDGTFGGTTSLAMGARPTEVILADIDGDNDLDLVSADYATGAFSNGAVGVRLNDGAGNFGAYISIATLQSAFDVVATDLNGDGRADLIVTRRDFGLVSVLLASGAPGSFAAPVHYNASTPNITTGTIAGDFTGDGRADIIAFNFGNKATGNAPGTVSLLVNDGNGGFSAPIDIASGSARPFEGAAYDLNNDGNLDLVYTSLGGVNGLTVMLGNGNGTFGAGTFLATAADPVNVAIGDVNGDGIADLVTGNGAGATVALFLGNGNGSFQSRIDLGIGSTSFAECVALGDANGDGRLDIIVNRGSSTGQAVLLNTGTWLSDTDTRAINVASVNDAPSGSNGSATFNEDTVYTFAAADFGFSDTADGNAFFSVFITTLPGAGTLRLSGVPVTVGQEISVGQIGNLTFTPAANANGMGYASFNFQVRDDGGTGNGGVDTDQSPNTFTLNVTPVNDPPSIDLNGAAAGTGSLASYTENGAATALAPAATVVDIDGLDFDTGTLTVTTTFGSSVDDVISVINQGNGAGQIGVSGMTISYGGTAIGTVAGGTGGTALVVTFNASADQAAVQALTRAIGFAVNSENPIGASRTIRFTLTDGDGGTSNNANASVTVLSVNDAPSGTDGTVTCTEDGSYTFATADFGFTDPAEGNSFIAVVISTLPANGTLTLNGNAVTANQFILTSSIAAGQLVFTPAPNGNGGPYASFTFQVVDGGGTTNGGQDTDQTPNTLNINVTAVNDAPVNTVPGAQSTNEDTAKVFSAGNGNQISVSDIDVGGGDLTVVLSVAHGTLTLSTVAGLSFSAGANGSASMTITGTQAAINTALDGLSYAPTANYNGPDTLQIQTSDNGNSGTGGILSDSDSVAITVNSINDAPAGANATLTFNEDATYTFAAADFGFSDPADGNAFMSVFITTLPANGVLTLSGVPVTAGQEIAVAQIGNLVFTPAPNANGNGYASFTFQVRDNGGTANGGVDTDQSANTITFNVTAVNDAPVNTVPGAQSTNEDNAKVFSSGNGNQISVSDVDVGAGNLTVTLTVSHGTITLSGVAGLIFNAGANGSATMTFTGTAAAINTALNGLSYAPALNYNGPDTLQIQTSDNGNTGTGGALSDTDSVNITINAVNDAPSGADATLTFNEDATYTFAAADFGFSDPVEGNSLLSVFITTLPANGVLTLSGVPVTAGQEIAAAQIGNLVFTPAPNANGNGYASFTFQVRDNGGTANGGVDTDQSANTITFNVTAVNDAPVNTVPGAQSTNEDNAKVFSSGNGNQISVSDVDVGGGNLTVTLTVSHGTITLSGVAGLTFNAGANGSATMTFTGTAAAINTALNGLSYAPAANYNGPDSLQIQTSDNGNTGTGGTLTDSDSVAITVVSVNDAPAGTDNAVTINEDSPYVLHAADFGFTDVNDGNGFAGVVITSLPTAGILIYDADGAGGMPGVLCPPGQFVSAAQLALGALTYFPANNGNGSPYATFTFQVRDDGGTTNGGIDTDQSANTFTFNVSAVNDAPVNSVPGAQSVNEDAALVLSTANANAIQVSDVDAGSGNVSVALSVAHGTLTLASTTGLTFSAGSNGSAGFTISGTLANLNAALGGGLTYAPAANYNGPDAISVQTTDNGNTGSGPAGTDSDSVAITVNSVNDAPAGTNNAVVGSEDDPVVFTAADFGFSDAIDGNSLLAVKITTLPGVGTLFLDSDGPGGNAPVAVTAGQFISAADIAAGHLYFLGALDGYGAPYASFTFQVQDNGGTANGGVDLDQSPNTMTINLTSDDVAPLVDLNSNEPGNDYTVTYIEGDPAIAISLDGTVVEPDEITRNDRIETLTITLTDKVAGDSLSLSAGLPAGFTSTTTVTAGTIKLVISGVGTGADYTAILALVQYATTSENPDVGGTDTQRTITVVANDGELDSLVATATIDIVGVDDPPTAAPDAFTITEAGTITGGNLFANNGSGPDSDPDSPLTIAAVNGSAANVDTQIVLASGALLTVHANGLFDYNPNHAFDFTPTSGSGASNTPSHDSFTYALAGGNTVTVTITLTGLDTDDILIGTAGADFLMGGAGNDFLVGGAGNDVMIGGTGDDTYYVDDSGDLIGEHAGEGFDRVAASISIALAADADIERLDVVNLTSTNAIDLTGSAIGNVIYGNNGVNILRGEDGNDELRGFGGDDFLVGGTGADLMVGGAGNDTFYVDNAGDAIGEIAGEGNDRIAASVSFVLSNGADVEILEAVNLTATTALDFTGSDSDNTITGNNGVNILRGEGGNDILSAAGGDDFLVGGTGNDTMTGGAGNDTYYVDSALDVVIEIAGEGTSDRVATSVSYALSANADVERLEAVTPGATDAMNLTGSSIANIITGNDGANILDGKGGSDILTGLGGADTFQFTTALGASNVDLIVGFVSGSDKIALDDAIFTAIGPVGALNANAFFAGTAAHDADDRIIYDQATGALLYDADGNGAGAAVQFATLSGNPALVAGDFTVI